MADVIWVYAEVIDGRISRATLEMLSRAAELGTAEVVLLGPAPDDAVATLSAHGASKVYRSDDPVYRECLTLPAVESIAALITAHRPHVLLFASSYGGRDIAAALSAKLDCGAVTSSTVAVFGFGLISNALGRTRTSFVPDPVSVLVFW